MQNVFTGALNSLAAIFICTISATAFSRQPRRTFIALILALLVVIQYYWLSQASFSAYPRSSNLITISEGNTNIIIRIDCEESAKGGKRALRDLREHTINPCWCKEGFICTDIGSNRRISNDECPTDGSAKCRNPSGNVNVALRIDAERDCTNAQPARCTKDHPCTPCEVERALEFSPASLNINDDTQIWKRCVSCSPQNRGECNFIEGEGPYCYENSMSRKAVPCKRCCSDATPVWMGSQCI